MTFDEWMRWQTGGKHRNTDDSDEAEKLAALLGAIDRAQAPSRHQGALL